MIIVHGYWPDKQTWRSAEIGTLPLRYRDSCGYGDEWRTLQHHLER
jgi:hypothetical protein